MKEELSARYEPQAIEGKWYAYWMEHGYFHSEPDDRRPYTIVIPPPNVTGVLHMGHMLNNTLQDVLIRRARMLGYNACWVPGTDHASIATEAKVVAKLKAEGIAKSSLTREQFLEHAWAWRNKHGDIILEQLKHLGASCDWARTAFTMDTIRSESVIKVFVDLYRKGLIYKGVRMVNWDPVAKTAVSDEEVIHRDEPGTLYYLRYKLAEGPGELLVATTRPETIMGDVAVCVNPEDPRYTGLVGKQVVVPLVGRSVPVIADAYVDPAFGTGALKITPAHDINDFAIGERFHLQVIDVFNADGTISAAAGLYVGLDRFEARARVVEDLAAGGLLEHQEDYTHSVGHSERTDSVIEPRLSKQWFVKMERLAKPALEAVLQGEISLIPSKFVNTYRHWMENVHDWCISRQLWWGHRIPAYYYGEGSYVVAETAEGALELARRESGNAHLQTADLKQDEDVLDTWFSSWLWPITVFDGIRHPDNAEINYYYPTQDLVTAPEILFFWVARMVMSGYEYRGKRPFQHVYLTGIVRDQQHRKMSKQLGNSPDPIKLMERYGADGVRVGMLLCTSAGNDLLFDESLIEQGRNFCNKVWNAFRLVQGWQPDPHQAQSQAAQAALRWFGQRLNQSLVLIETAFSEYRISEALLEAYRLFRDDFASWLLESLKPTEGRGLDAASLHAVRSYFEQLLAILHPYMPFLTEELWHAFDSSRAGQTLMLQPMPRGEAGARDRLSAYALYQQVVTNVRNVRHAHGLPTRAPMALYYRGENPFTEEETALVKQVAGLEQVEACEASPQGAVSFLVDKLECFVPLATKVDLGAAREKLEGELRYMQGFLSTVEKKLGNAQFVAHAPAAVVQLERKKQADAEAKIAALRAQLEALA